MEPSDRMVVRSPARRGTPAVSVIIPFYDVEAELDACLRSVLGQDFPDIEILLVDDASRDGSRAAAERAAAADGRVGIIAHRENRGLGPARNTGARHARGDHLLFLDSDDVLADGAVLRRLVSSARDGRCPVVVGACSRIAPDGSVVEHDRVQDGLARAHEGMAVEASHALRGVLGLRGAPYLPMRAWGTLIEHSYYRRTGLEFPPGEHEDMAHTPFLYARAGRIFYDRRIAVLYRVRGTSLSSTGWSVAKMERYAALWRETGERIDRFGLERERGNFAALYAWHLSWKLDANGFAAGAEREYYAVLEEILAAVDGRTDRKRVFDVVDALKRVPAGREAAASRMLVGTLPGPLLLDYYRRRLGLRRRFARMSARHPPDDPASFAFRRAEAALAASAGAGATDALIACDRCLNARGDLPSAAPDARRPHRLLHWLRA